MSNTEIIKDAQMRLFEYSVGDIFRSIRGGALVGAYIQSFCFIDYLAYIANVVPWSGNAKNYTQFIENKFPKDYKEQFVPERIYATRCALVHTYGQSNAMAEASMDYYLLQHKNPENHLKFENCTFHLNLSNFVTDVIHSGYEYLSSTQTHNEKSLEETACRAKKVLSVFKNSSVMQKGSFGSIDPLIARLDYDEINWMEMGIGIHTLLLTK